MLWWKIWKLKRQLKNASSHYDRSEAVEALVKISDARVVYLLIAALKDSDWNVRESAASALGKIGDARAVEPLIIALKYPGAVKAAEALGEIGDAHAVEPLIAALKDENNYVRQKAAEALGKIGDARATDSLIAGLKDSDGRVRYEAAEALGKIANNVAVPHLIYALNDSYENVREAANYSLKAIGTPKALQAAERYQKKVELEKQAKIFVQRREWVRAVKLGNFAIEPLIVALKDSSEYVRLKAAEALGKIGDKRAVEPLIAALKDSGWKVCQMATKALGKIGESAVKVWIAALKSSDEDVRSKAAEALGKIGDKRAVEPLIAALKDSSEYVRSDAAEALGKIGDKRAVEPLIAALKNFNRQAAEALGKIGDKRAVEPLIAALEYSDHNIHWWAAAALEVMKYKPINDTLLKNSCLKCWKILEVMKYKPINDTQRAMMFVARGDWDNAVTLGTAAVEPLIATLKVSDRDVRWKAAEALGKIGDKRAVEPLIATLKNSDEGGPGLPATKALVEIGDLCAIQPLVAAIRDHSRDTTNEVFALERLIETKGRSFSVEDLKSITQLQYAYKTVYLRSGGCAIAWASAGPSKLESFDCSQLRQLARQELIRRCIKA